jgi:peroxiredoxin
MASATIGESAPNFKLQNLTGQQISLNSFRGKQAVVLVFIYGDT